MLATAIGLVRCASVSPVKPPEVELDSVGIRDPSLMAATFVFGLRVQNPNLYRLKVKKLDYNLKIGGKDFSSGQLSGLGSVPAHDKSVLEVPVRIPYLKLFHTIYEMTQSGKLAYQLKGAVQVSGLSVPFDLGGDLPLPQPPPTGTGE
jgi:LEA14-like dessication related protein